jgi:hypothetical protein
MGTVARAGGMSCTAGYSYGVAGRAGAPAGSPISAGSLSTMDPAEHPPSPAKRAKPAIDRAFANVRTMLSKACQPDRKSM